MAEERIKSEITGKVWKLEAQPGASVAEDDTIMLIESMKMEIPVLVTSPGVLREFLVKEGDDVAEGQDVAVIDT